MVCPVAAAVDGSSIHAALHDANGRPWPAEPAPVRSSTQATTVASTARTDGPMGESVDPNERGRQLVAQCKTLKKEVSTHGQGCPEPRDLPKGGMHRPYNGQPLPERQRFLLGRDFGEGQLSPSEIPNSMIFGRNSDTSVWSSVLTCPALACHEDRSARLAYRPPTPFSGHRGSDSDPGSRLPTTFPLTAAERRAAIQTDRVSRHRAPRRNTARFDRRRCRRCRK
jgi:hypothetical protein